MGQGIKALHSILAVDDDSEIRELLSIVIGRLGHDCVTAVDGMDALEKMTKSRFDIVITDIEMPRMDGMELIRRIIADFDGVDVMAITGHLENYTEIIELGASDFISKPFCIDRLTARVTRLLRERFLREQFKTLSILDGLTGLYNRRHFDENLPWEASRASRQNYGLFLLLIDIDNFKEYNDRFGHQQGDTVLKKLGDIVLCNVRENVDSCYRYGGDEFAVVIPHVSGPQALMVAERLRTKYNETSLVPTSLSMGVSEFKSAPQNQHQDLEALFRDADQALYLAKNNGGNQVWLNGEGGAWPSSLLENLP